MLDQYAARSSATSIGDTRMTTLPTATPATLRLRNVTLIDGTGRAPSEHTTVVVRQGRYVPPTMPGYSITIKPSSRARYRFPDGDAWR